MTDTAYAELWRDLVEHSRGYPAHSEERMMARWRKRHAHALLIVDQFEELFTLNAPEVQARFAQLLGRLVSEADVAAYYRRNRSRFASRSIAT